MKLAICLLIAVILVASVGNNTVKKVTGRINVALVK